jgi:hypothetical protein
LLTQKTVGKLSIGYELINKKILSFVLRQTSVI